MKEGGNDMSEQFPVLQGAEPFYFEGNETGILVIHGFTGSPHSMRYLGELYRDEGFTVCGPRLKGHGTHYEDMEQTTYEDWIASIDEGYEWLTKRCKQIIVTGLSMGGTLTLHMAQKHADIVAMIPINATINIDQYDQILSLKEPRFIDGIGSDIKADGIKELAYMKTPVRSLHELFKLKKETHPKLDQIKCPALVIVSSEDHVVPPKESDYIYEHISSTIKKKVVLENSYHVATLDNDKDKIFEESLAFIRKTLEYK